MVDLLVASDLGLKKHGNLGGLILKAVSYAEATAWWSNGSLPFVRTLPLLIRALGPLVHLSVKNQNTVATVEHRSPQEIMAAIAALDLEEAEVLERIRGLVG